MNPQMMRILALLGQLVDAARVCGLPLLPFGESVELALTEAVDMMQLRGELRERSSL